MLPTGISRQLIGLMRIGLVRLADLEACQGMMSKAKAT